MTVDCAGPAGVSNGQLGVTVASTYAAKTEGPGAVGRATIAETALVPDQPTATATNATRSTRANETRLRGGRAVVDDAGVRRMVGPLTGAGVAATGKWG